MLLCDVGNSSFHFLDADKDYKEDVAHFNSSSISETVYYICVNHKVKSALTLLKNWVDLSLHVDMDKYYDTMGIDRIFACEAVEDALIVDAGTAITVDLVENGKFCGGFIYPGVKAMSKTYKDISSALSYSFNFEVNLDKMPKNSADAISYGYLKTLHVELMSHNKDIVLTGGDADKLSVLFKDAKIDKQLIFNGMKKIIKKANIC